MSVVFFFISYNEYSHLLCYYFWGVFSLGIDCNLIIISLQHTDYIISLSIASVISTEKSNNSLIAVTFIFFLLSFSFFLSPFTLPTLSSSLIQFTEHTESVCYCLLIVLKILWDIVRYYLIPFTPFFSSETPNGYMFKLAIVSHKCLIQFCLFLFTPLCFNLYNWYWYIF